MKKSRNNKGQTSIRRDYSYWEFLVLYPECCEELQKELRAQLEQAPCPSYFCNKEVPTSLNSISYGTLDDLSESAKAEDPAVECLKIILGVTKEDVYAASAIDVFGFAMFIKREIERINNLFASIEVDYNSDEIAAGVEKLSFGSFGVLDWYARRMGITNQNDVRDVAWIRIFSCMKNDVEQNNYERRLYKQYNKKR